MRKHVELTGLWAIPVFCKPDTYKAMGRLSEEIDVKMIYYTKTRTGLKIEVED